MPEQLQKRIFEYPEKTITLGKKTHEMLRTLRFRLDLPYCQLVRFALETLIKEIDKGRVTTEDIYKSCYTERKRKTIVKQPIPDEQVSDAIKSKIADLERKLEAYKNSGCVESVDTVDSVGLEMTKAN